MALRLREMILRGELAPGERLAEVGITDEMFARVHGPIGLNIGAKSPAEIAVSILGQIVEVRARRLEALAGPKVVAA